MKYILSMAALFLAATTAFANPIEYKDISGKIQISLDPKPLSYGAQGVDVLLVIDDSASMAMHQNRLKMQSQTISEALAKISNAHVGVLTTDGDDGGQIISGQFPKPWLSSSDPNFAKALSEQIMVGVVGSGQEKPFQAIMNFLAQRNNGNNANFWRENASLAIIIVSDAADQSSVGSSMDFAYKLYQSKPAGTQIGFHGLIIPTGEQENNTCTRDEFSQTPTSIEDVIRIFNGHVVSLCADPAKYNEGLSLIANDILAKAPFGKLQVAVPLKYTSIEQSLEVSYGSQIPRGPLTWAYDKNFNRVVFNKDFNWNEQPDGTKLVIQFEINE